MKIHGKIIRFPTAGLLLTGYLLFSFFPFSAAAETTSERYFSSAGDFADWRGEGIEAGGPVADKLQVRGGEEIRLYSPSGLGIPAADRPYLRIRFRPYSPRYLRVFWFDRAGRPVPVPRVVQPPLDRNYHTFWIPLARGEEHRGEVETLGLIFGGQPGWVEIETVEIRSFNLRKYLADQAQEFFLPRPFHPGTINSLPSPRIFNRNLVVWLNKAALLTMLFGLAFYFKSRGKQVKRIALRVALTLLLIWIAYDLRDTYNHFLTAGEIQRSYVKPPPEEKTFPALGDFYRFVEFCREHLPPSGAYEIIPRGYWPYDCRLNYYLYPRHYLSERNREYYAGQPLYYLIYNQPSFRFSPDQERVISADGLPVTPRGKLIARYNQYSFIFKEY